MGKKGRKDRWVGYELCKWRKGQKSSRRTKRHFPITAGASGPPGVVDGQLGTKRRIDVDNLARASFERQIPRRKISDFLRKRGVPRERTREKGEKGHTAVKQFHAFVSPCGRRMYAKTILFHWCFAHAIRPSRRRSKARVSRSVSFSLFRLLEIKPLTRDHCRPHQHIQYCRIMWNSIIYNELFRSKVMWKKPSHFP